MTTVTSVNWLHEADAIRILLESNGIQAFIPDQGTLTAQPFYSNALGGVRVQVQDADFEKAQAILDENLMAKEKGIFECPECQSDSVEYQPVSRQFAFLSLLLIGIPLLWKKREYICRSCGHKWKNLRVNDSALPAE